MRKIFYSFLIFCFTITIFSCGKSLDETVNDALGTGGDSGTGGGTSYSCSFKNTKAFIVGNAVTEKCIFYDCPKSKIVIWDLNGCMKVVGESVMGAVDAASHNNSIYIADDAGYYWIVGAGNKIEKKQINYPSGHKPSEITGISVNSIGDVYVAGKVRKNNKNYTAYWKNGELVKTFKEDGTYDSEIHVAADSKGNVFIPGYRVDGQHNHDGAIWINGNIKILEPQSGIVEATDAVVGSETASGSNVWISGAHGSSTLSLAGYWRRKPNGTINQVTKVTRVGTYNLPKSSAKFSRPTSIFISGSTVYMAGTVNVINAGEVPVYWKNQTQHELPVEFDLNTCDYCKAEPNDISLLDGKVLVVGNYYDANDKVDSYYTHGEKKAVYWLDKKLHILCESCGSSYAVAVVVMD